MDFSNLHALYASQVIGYLGFNLRIGHRLFVEYLLTHFSVLGLKILGKILDKLLFSTLESS